ncbi:MAG: hypothetical protein KAJ19_15545, partial [Gammaproteobacteria bacterium]|nr:hypothetical protein [Gammaproteobacteria bacterium]
MANKRPVIPAAVLPVAADNISPASIPWYQFFDDVKKLAIDNAFQPAVAFASSNTTTGLGVSKVYRFTGSTGAVISLEDNLLRLGAPEALYIFSVVDEGGSAATNPITISGGAATISGANTVLINTDYGSLT